MRLTEIGMSLRTKRGNPSITLYDTQSVTAKTKLSYSGEKSYPYNSNFAKNKSLWMAIGINSIIWATRSFNLIPLKRVQRPRFRF